MKEHAVITTQCSLKVSNSCEYFLLVTLRRHCNLLQLLTLLPTAVGLLHILTKDTLLLVNKNRKNKVAAGKLGNMLLIMTATCCCKSKRPKAKLDIALPCVVVAAAIFGCGKFNINLLLLLLRLHCYRLTKLKSHVPKLAK